MDWRGSEGETIKRADIRRSLPSARVQKSSGNLVTSTCNGKNGDAKGVTKPWPRFQNIYHLSMMFFFLLFPIMAYFFFFPINDSQTVGNAGHIPRTRASCTRIIVLRQSAHCHLLYRGEKVPLIRTGLSLSAIHHHLTRWSSILITLSRSYTRARTHTHIRGWHARLHAISV